MSMSWPGSNSLQSQQLMVFVFAFILLNEIYSPTELYLEIGTRLVNTILLHEVGKIKLLLL